MGSRTPRGVNKGAGDKFRNLDDLIWARATLILQPPARVPQGTRERVELTRYRTAEAYATGQPGYAGAGLSMAAYHAMLGRVIDGLGRLGVRYVVRWSDDVPQQASA